jgi:Flp pilus assembly protein TadG
MRVRRVGLIRLREERGAVAAMVAISLLCLLGMLVLTFDLGRGVALKRNMVNAADAGALAAARECGLANGPGAASGAADELVTDNNDAAEVSNIEFDDEAQCSGLPSGGKSQVTVTASVPQDYFFAQIFGFDEGTVVASATAEYTTGAANPVPLKLDQLKVEECNDGKQPGYTGAECYFVFEKVGKGSQRGWLDFPEGWPIQGVDTNPKSCTSQAGGSRDMVDYINNMGGLGDPSSGAFRPKMWDPPPTYVCAAGGVPANADAAIVDWLNKVADMEPQPAVNFPVVACNGQGAPCYPWITKTGSEAYPVVRFQGFRVVNSWRGQDARKQANCNFQTKGRSDVFCIQLAVAGPDDPTIGGAVEVRLVK